MNFQERFGHEPKPNGSDIRAFIDHDLKDLKEREKLALDPTLTRFECLTEGGIYFDVEEVREEIMEILEDAKDMERQLAIM